MSRSVYLSLRGGGTEQVVVLRFERGRRVAELAIGRRGQLLGARPQPCGETQLWVSFDGERLRVRRQEGADLALLDGRWLSYAPRIVERLPSVIELARVRLLVGDWAPSGVDAQEACSVHAPGVAEATLPSFVRPAVDLDATRVMSRDQRQRFIARSAGGERQGAAAPSLDIATRPASQPDASPDTCVSDGRARPGRPRGAQPRAAAREALGWLRVRADRSLRLSPRQRTTAVGAFAVVSLLAMQRSVWGEPGPQARAREGKPAVAAESGALLSVASSPRLEPRGAGSPEGVGSRAEEEAPRALAEPPAAALAVAEADSTGPGVVGTSASPWDLAAANGKSPQRLAADALSTGDTARAIGLYRWLAARQPQRPEYAAALRILQSVD